MGRITGNRVRQWIWNLSWLTIVFALFYILYTLPVEDINSVVMEKVKQSGAWGPAVFVIAYIIATIAFIPGSFLTIASGTVFGLFQGLLLTSIASTVGAAIAFLIARYLAKGSISTLRSNYPTFSAIDQAIADGGWKVVALTRLSPIFPFNLQNYLYGLTSIGFWSYVITSMIAMLPGTFAFVYVGYLSKEIFLQNRERTPAEWALLVVGLLATIAVTVYLTKQAKNRLPLQEEHKSETEASSEIKVSLASLSPVILLAIATLSLAVYLHRNSDSVALAIREYGIIRVEEKTS